MEASMLLISTVVIAVYFAPWIIAVNRDHKNAASICLLNLFLGWTFLGWLAALIWSATHQEPAAKG